MAIENVPAVKLTPRQRHSLRGATRAACALTVAIAAMSVTPAQAGRWVVGGMFDDVRLVPVQFLRFLAEPGEGQMTIRCDQQAGLWLDAGVDGNGVVPPGLERGGAVEVSFTFVQPDGPVTINVVGELLIRLDGAVLAEIGGPAALPLGPALLGTAERIDIAIGGTVRSVPLAEAHANLVALAERCPAWPR